MVIEVSSNLTLIDEAILNPVVRRALGRKNFQVQGWEVSQLGGGAGNPVSVGLYRFQGTGADQDGTAAWSVVLKIIQSPANAGWMNMGEGDDQTHWNYWKREYWVYHSGLLDALPEGMLAPRCYQLSELPGDFAWLWIEDIDDTYSGRWPLDRYALAARHLGRLNGQYVSARPIPDFPWYSTPPTRQWLVSLPFWKSFPWDHPQAQARFPKEDKNPFRSLLLENESFFAKMEQLPKTICHGDTYPTNFRSRSIHNQEHTVALDWALMSLSPVGDDLGQLVYGAVMNLNSFSLEEIDQVLFESYLQGLHDSHCHLEPRWVRFGYTTSAALRVGLFKLYLLYEEIQTSQSENAQPVGSSVEMPEAAASFEVVMAKEAHHYFEIVENMPPLPY